MPLGHGTQLGTICVAIEPNHIHYSWSLFFILQDSANPKKFLRSLQLGRRRRGHELLACVGKSGAAADYHHGGRRSQLQVGPVIFSAAVHNLWHWKPCLHDCVKNFSAHALSIICQLFLYCGRLLLCTIVRTSHLTSPMNTKRLQFISIVFYSLMSPWHWK